MEGLKGRMKRIYWSVRLVVYTCVSPLVIPMCRKCIHQNSNIQSRKNALNSNGFRPRWWMRRVKKELELVLLYIYFQVKRMGESRMRKTFLFLFFFLFWRAYGTLLPVSWDFDIDCYLFYTV